MKAKLLRREVLFLCLIADGLVDSGSGLLALWIGVTLG